MMKHLLLASALGLALMTPAYADTEMISCDDATMTKIKTDIDSMTDKEKQTTSLAEYEMAMTEMKSSKLEECQTRMRQLMEKNKSN